MQLGEIQQDCEHEKAYDQKCQYQSHGAQNGKEDRQETKWIQHIGVAPFELASIAAPKARDSFRTAACPAVTTPLTVPADVSLNSAWQLSDAPGSCPGFESAQSTANITDEPSATSNFLTVRSILGTGASLCRALSNTVIPCWCRKASTTAPRSSSPEGRNPTTALFHAESRVISPDQDLRRIDARGQVPQHQDCLDRRRSAFGWRTTAIRRSQCVVGNGCGSATAQREDRQHYAKRSNKPHHSLPLEGPVEAPFAL
jgi:hypothetical protein